MTVFGHPVMKGKGSAPSQSCWRVCGALGMGLCPHHGQPSEDTPHEHAVEGRLPTVSVWSDNEYVIGVYLETVQIPIFAKLSIYLYLCGLWFCW